MIGVSVTSRCSVAVQERNSGAQFEFEQGAGTWAFMNPLHGATGKTRDGRSLSHSVWSRGALVARSVEKVFLEYRRLLKSLLHHRPQTEQVADKWARMTVGSMVEQRRNDDIHIVTSLFGMC